MRVDLFDFDLPPERIAQEPAEPRDAARLLLIGKALRHARLTDLPDLLSPGDLLVCNDTRVLPTRFWGRRGEAAVEVTLIQQQDDCRWWALAKPGRKLRPQDRVDLAPDLVATVEAKHPDGRTLLAFDLEGTALVEAIRRQGAMPLPPYIQRAKGGDAEDRRLYQTIFAQKDGSVAAPTASLHFTDRLVSALEWRGIERAFVTLHVGPGTFFPVKVEDTDRHVMHAEWYEVPEATAAAIAQTRERGGRVVAAGTTVLRSLETSADLDGRVRAGQGQTSLFVTPGYRFHIVDRLLTNFHLPRSTLFMLVCAFAGVDRMKKAYAEAIREDYRFYSYGDACLLDRNDAPL
jgi:S-adenosylmethionine:tRNA ribosyltransferase-isomerase